MLHRIGTALVALLALAGGGPEAWAQPVGPEFRANTYTAGLQWRPSVAGLSGGGFVVTWSSHLQDGDGGGVYGQRYSAAGAPAGGEFRINSRRESDQGFPSAVGLSGGGFVVTWHSHQDGSSYGVYGQRYSAAGARVGNEFRVNTTTASHQDFPSVASLSNGGFVVTWVSGDQDGSLSGVYGQLYSAAGARSGGEFQVNTYTTNDQSNPSVAGLSGGGFVVTWMSVAQDGNSGGIYGQRYGAAGTRAGSEFRVNTTKANSQAGPSAAGLSGGGFVVTWHSYAQDGSLTGVYGQRYSPAGLPVGGEFLVNSRWERSQLNSSVAALSNGGFVVTWQSQNQDEGFSSLYGVYGQLYSATGARAGGEFQVNTYEAKSQERPSIAALSGGGFVIGWQSGVLTGSGGQDGSLFGVYGQRFANPAPTITLNPVSRTVRPGQTVTFGAEATGSPAPTVQWQVRAGLRRFENIPGATAKTLTFTTTLSQNGNQYRAVFSNSLGTATTKAATLTVTRS